MYQHRAERNDDAIHTKQDLDGDKHAAISLPMHSALVPEHPERSMQRIHVIMREGTARARVDAEGTGARHAPRWDGLIVEQRVSRLRYEREEARAVVKTGIEEKGLGEREVHARRSSSAT
jgi:hypothetical protein